MTRLEALFSCSPRFLRRFNAAMTFAWLLFTIPVLLLPGWKESVALLVFISIYANVAGHFSAWQAARVEDRQEQDATGGCACGATCK